LGHAGREIHAPILSPYSGGWVSLKIIYPGRNNMMN